MSWWELLAVFAAGMGAGLINTVVGSGTLITFPTLLAIGVPPIVANVSNSVGLAPGGVSGVLATRPELVGQRPLLLRLGPASLLGGLIGAVLLLTLPSAAFNSIVPVLIGLGCVLVIVQPYLSRRIQQRRDARGDDAPRHHSLALWFGVMLTGAYGGYFGAAQGVILIAILGIALSESMARVNAVKNALSLIVNAVSGLTFILVSDINWPVAGAIAAGSIIGAQIGGRVGRKLPPVIYRVIIVVVGVIAIIALVR